MVVSDMICIKYRHDTSLFRASFRPNYEKISSVSVYFKYSVGAPKRYCLPRGATDDSVADSVANAQIGRSFNASDA
eukprot:1544923-Pleurochrysis_carterae.AAC.2